MIGEQLSLIISPVLATLTIVALVENGAGDGNLSRATFGIINYISRLCRTPYVSEWMTRLAI